MKPKYWQKMECLYKWPKDEANGLAYIVSGKIEETKFSATCALHLRSDTQTTEMTFIGLTDNHTQEDQEAAIRANKEEVRAIKKLRRFINEWAKRSIAAIEARYPELEVEIEEKKDETP